jgi:site-specific DNA-methyltransferase (adenine-specific)
MELEIVQDDDGKFITPYLCIEDWGKFGTALKPSFEPIIVARKPFKGSLIDNIIENGVGGINIDECRVAFSGDKWNTQKSGSTAKAFNLNEQQREAGTGILAGYECSANDNGRFPANTILTYDETDFDEVCGGFPKDNKEQSNSRYFYCAKASAKDRNEGLDIEIEEYVLKDNVPEDIKNKILNSLTS